MPTFNKSRESLKILHFTYTQASLYAIALPADIGPAPCPACLYDFGKMHNSVHFLVGSLFAVGTDDACSVDAELVADDGF